MNAVLVLGLLMNLIALPIVAKRLWFLYRVIGSGQPAPERIDGVDRAGRAHPTTELREVLGPASAAERTHPGLAHFFVFWAFVILGTVYVEAYGVMLGPDDFAIPVIGHWPVLGFAQDLIALMAVSASRPSGGSGYGTPRPSSAVDRGSRAPTSSARISSCS